MSRNFERMLWDIADWDGWPMFFSIFVVIAFLVGSIWVAMYINGYFYEEVENYDFTAQVYDKDHYTTHSVTYITTGKTRTPVHHTHHHYKIMWEDGEECGELEIGKEHYNLIKIGDFVNIHCSVKADNDGELHYYYNFKGY